MLLDTHFFLANTSIFCHKASILCMIGEARMSLFKAEEWSFTEKVLDWVTTNPFDPSFVEKERVLLGQPVRLRPGGIAWRPGADLWGPASAHSVYSEEVHQRIINTGEELKLRLKDGAPASQEELGRYELLTARYWLYCKYGEEMDRFIDAAVRGRSTEKERLSDMKKMWERFRIDYEDWFTFNHPDFPKKYKPEHLFACFFLFRRAFYHIFFNIVGTSKSITKLRSAVWESIVTHDLPGWMETLYPRMKDIPTLITGPSGTGKEQVAKAIGRSLYIPFDPAKKAFATDILKAYNPVSLSELSPQLVESELFGHVKGAFTGAVCDRVGKLEECPEQGAALFLDEIGELPAEIQVKLLRVLQERCFHSIGENKNKTFHGRIIAATNRDLVAALQAGRFREDFYYRLCAVRIETPSLREQLADRPADISLMVEHVCRNVVGEEKAARLAQEVVAWIERNLPCHSWPGNFRELEQCVRSYTVRKDYQPVRPTRARADNGPPPATGDPVAEACATLADAVLNNGMAYTEIKRRLFTLVRRGTSTAQAACNLLGIKDVRTLNVVMKGADNRPAIWP
jgi:transcriptional regulator with AAA-type ATPase domain